MSYDYLFKLIVIGDPGVGKTAVLGRLTQKKVSSNYRPTIGLDFATKSTLFRNRFMVKSHIWDTAGQENFGPVIASYYRGIAGAVIVFDVTNRRSFDRVAHWLAELESKNDLDTHISIMLLGNKIDKTCRQVSEEEGVACAQKYNMLYMETSATRSDNIPRFYDRLVDDIFRDMDSNGDNMKLKRHYLGPAPLLTPMKGVNTRCCEIS